MRKKRNKKKFALTRENIMVIFNNGYLKGVLNGARNGYCEEQTYQKDLLTMESRIK
jgi:hypothetical protein